MASNEPLNKESVLSPALANAALLIAAPSLGCLRTYTKAFTDLCRVYGLHVPDLEDVLLYSPTASSSCKVRLSKTNCFQKPTQVTPNICDPKAQHLAIKKEPEDPECDTVQVKQEIADNNMTLYNAWLYDTKPNIQGTSLDKHVEREEIQLDILINNLLEIPLKIKAKPNVFHTKPSTPGTSLEKHVKNEDTQLEIPIHIDLETPLKRKAESDASDTKPNTKGTSVNKHLKSKDKQIGIQFVHTLDKMEISLKSKDISKVLIQNQVGTKSHGYSEKMGAPNEGRPKIYHSQEDISQDHPPSANPDPYPTMLRDTTESLTSPKSSKVGSNSSMLMFSPKTNVYSILDITGIIKYAPSSEDARKIMAQCGMPFNFYKQNYNKKLQQKYCLVHVDTIMEGPSRTSTLHIWLKKEGRDVIIPFATIRQISKYKKSIMVRFSLNKCIKNLYLGIHPTCLRTEGTISYYRSKKVNIAATINWLHKFLG